MSREVVSVRGARVERLYTLLFSTFTLFFFASFSFAKRKKKRTRKTVRVRGMNTKKKQEKEKFEKKVKNTIMNEINLNYS